MKRSEMIAIIQKSLESNGEGYHSNTASDVLDAIEKAGMMPPNIEKREPDWEINMHLPTYDWEKE